MPQPVNFEELMADLTKFQEIMAQIQAGLTRPKEKELLGDLLDRVQKARVEVEETYPKTAQFLNNKLQDTRTEAQAMLEDNARRSAELHARMDEAKKQAKEVPPPRAKKAPSPVKPSFHLDPEKGNKLRLEMLQFLGIQAKQDGKGRGLGEDHEIWEDWDWTS